jgi:hypothetical protein
VGAKVDEAPKERSAKTDPMVPPANWSSSLSRSLSLSLAEALTQALSLSLSLGLSILLFHRGSWAILDPLHGKGLGARWGTLYQISFRFVSANGREYSTAHQHP